MSCVLRIGGDDLMLASLLAILPNPQAVFKKGDRLGSRVIQQNGANYLVSDADFDEFDAQKQDARSYLTENRDLLEKAMSLPGIEGACLDFALEETDHFTQGGLLEPDLLKLAGDLGLGIKISIYPSSEE